MLKTTTSGEASQESNSQDTKPIKVDLIKPKLEDDKPALLRLEDVDNADMDELEICPERPLCTYCKLKQHLNNEIQRNEEIPKYTNISIQKSQDPVPGLLNGVHESTSVISDANEDLSLINPKVLSILLAPNLEAKRILELKKGRETLEAESAASGLKPTNDGI